MFRGGTQARFWLLIAVLTAAALWLLKPVLLPFVLGLAIAYFLNPVVDALARRGIARWLCAIGVLLGFATAIGLLMLLILPLLQSQVGALVKAIPGYVEQLRTHALPAVEDWFARVSPGSVEKAQAAAGQYAGSVAGFAGKALQSLVTGSLAIIDVLALLVVTPVVAFYMMRDWPQLTGAVDSALPRRHYDVIRAQLAEINRTLSGFVRGQALVCLCLGFVYGIGLTLTGVPYSAAIGVSAGILSFIPFVGTTFAWVASLAFALAQFNSWMHIGSVVAVLLLGHALEAYILGPRLVGHRVGLHPVWILFALIAGARLMGFTGVLIAVPVAAVTGVLARFAIAQYKASALYKDPLAPNRP